MIFYRYEKPDGGGPYCSREGILRTNPSCIMNDDTLYGALSVENLNKWFENKPNELLQDCKIIKYNGELLYKSHYSPEIIFKKSTAKRIGEIKCLNIKKY